MKLFARLLILLIVLVVLSAATETEWTTRERFLDGMDTPYDPSRDECEIGRDDRDRPIYGMCQPSVHFPNCSSDSSICYNRVNRRDKFYEDKNPYYAINPRRVLCYPNEWVNWGGCSSCTPGRFCLAENRCILDEKNYNCTQWL